jgi:hypothetical protein
MSTTAIPTAREAALGLIAVGSRWLDNEDRSPVTVVAVDDPPYPVQFRIGWTNVGPLGRATVEGFLDDYSPDDGWGKAILAAIEARDAAHLAELERARVLLERIVNNPDFPVHPAAAWDVRAYLKEATGGNRE